MKKRALKMAHRLTPTLWDCWKGYTLQTFGADLIAGLTVGLVALPLAMAFAISSGVPPEAGIYTAVLAGLVVSALGGSRCQISGPTGAFVVVVAGIVAKFGFSGLLMCTAMAGAMLLIMGLTGLGMAVQYIPRSVTIGFTNGIAVLIASTQIRDFFGLQLAQMPGEFLERLRALADHAGTYSLVSVGLASGTVLIILLWPRITKRVPGSIVALLLMTTATVVLGFQVETVGSKYGGIPTGLPSVSIPDFKAELIVPLLPSAITVALLAAIESLLSAVVADNMTGDKHKPDAELMAQGTANLLVPMIGGIPITGAIARTATNIRSGGKTPVSGIVHGLVLLVILLTAAPLAQHIPLAALAGILMVVAYNMGEWAEIPTILRLSWADRIVWGTTFALTVFADLTVAVEVGMVLAALLYIRQVTETTTVSLVTNDYIKDGKPHILQDKHIPPYVSIIRIHGPFLFGAAAKLEESCPDLSGLGAVVVLRLRNMTALDGTGIHALETFAERVHESGRALLICGMRRQPARLIRGSDFAKMLGERNLLPHVEAALKRAREIRGEGTKVEEELVVGVS